jgi:hypothetical protein
MATDFTPGDYYEHRSPTAPLASLGIVRVVGPGPRGTVAVKMTQPRSMAELLSVSHVRPDELHSVALAPKTGPAVDPRQLAIPGGLP